MLPLSNQDPECAFSRLRKVCRSCYWIDRPPPAHGILLAEAMPLVAIDPLRTDVLLDLAYARADNVTGKPIYAHSRCYLHPDAVRLLARAVALAAPWVCA